MRYANRLLAFRHSLTEDSVERDGVSMEKAGRPRIGRPNMLGSLVKRKSLPVMCGAAKRASGTLQSGSPSSGTLLITASATPNHAHMQCKLTTHVEEHGYQVSSLIDRQVRGRFGFECHAQQLRQVPRCQPRDCCAVFLPKLGIFNKSQQRTQFGLECCPAA